jgi:hypothetical protein
MLMVISVVYNVRNLRYKSSKSLNEHQEDLINRQYNLPLIEEATERVPCGSRILRF